MKYGFFVFILAFMLTMIVYTIVRGSQALAPYGALKTVYLVSMITLTATLFGGLFFESQLPHSVGKVLSFVGYSFFIVLAYLFISFLLVDIIRAVNHFLPFITDMKIFRLSAMVITLTVLSVLMIWGNYKFNHPKTVTMTVESSKPLQHKEIKIVAISDVHLGVSIDKSKLKKYVAMINAENPDLVLIAGDLIDRSLQPVISQKMDEELRMIKAPMGVYGIFGNHEYYGEGNHHIADFYKKSNITLLQDSCVLLKDEIYLAGRDDKHNPHRKNLEDILAGRTGKPILLLDHQPFHLEDAEKNNVDLQISGHTHNGQFFPANLIVKSMFEMGYGSHKRGNTNYYISSGLGLWGPQYRLGSQSEMVVINFRY